MTDHPPPEPTDVEARLRAALRAVADRDPVAGDLDELRRRTDGQAFDGPRASTRSPRRRVQVLIAAVVALVVGAVGLVALRAGDDPDQGLTTDRPPATGWYLPEGLGTDWDLLDVYAFPNDATAGLRRYVLLGSGREVDQAVVVTEHLVTDPLSRPATLVPVDGTDGLFTMNDSRSAEASEPIVVALQGDRVLTVGGPDGTQDERLAIAERWRETDGLAIGPSPASGLRRLADVSWVSPATQLASAIGFDDQDLVAGAQVTVELRQRATGTGLRYRLSAPETGGRPTGVGLGDAGASAGLAPDERPERLDVDGARGPVWRSAVFGIEGADQLGPAAITVLLPAADVSINASADSSSDLSEEATADLEAAARELAGDLRPVGTTEWQEAVRQAVDDPDPALLAPTLADAPTPAPDMSTATTTTVPGASTTAQGGPPPGPTDGGPPPTGPPSDDADGTVPRVADPRVAEDRLFAFAIERSDASFAELPLAPTVEIGVDPTQGVPARRESRADLRDPGAWVVDLAGTDGPDDTASALDVLGETGGAAIAWPGTMDPGCPEPRGGDDPQVVTITGSSGDDCAEWFGVALRVVDGQITEVRLALPDA
ncbi:hypothetical protein PO878_12780 [Iamia majanohamensis]|uniref:Uncharacterized protein n=1 Tax=Iamia majanohamensis TaxID=467976 RepID=A0AAE9Y501_9ACTN|nr:hypothetical protein [Iamia majanohamensis]WCO65371.1 hypothetical protein PO878_12780 [Iamia majanohamensis]